MRMYLLQRISIYSILLLAIHLLLSTLTSLLPVSQYTHFSVYLLLFYLLLSISASQYSYFSFLCFSITPFSFTCFSVYLQLLGYDYWLRAHVHTHTRALLYATQLNSTPSTFSPFFLLPFGSVFSIIF